MTHDTPDTSTDTHIDAYWFAASDILPHGDGRKVIIGEAHSVEGPLVLCKHALHASRDPFDALQNAPGPYLYKVRCWGDVIEQGDKLGARHREYVDMRDATQMLLRYARECALSVVHLWKAPDVVLRYLKTGDENLRTQAAWAADAARLAAEAAQAAKAAKAAQAAKAARLAADATWAAEAARLAADAAWAARLAAKAAQAAQTRSAQRQQFNGLVAELFKEAQP